MPNTPNLNGWMGTTQGLCIDGVNSAVRPDLIGQNQVAWMVNGTVRDGKPRTRQGLVERLVLPNGKMQGAGFYSFSGGKIMLSIGGRIYRVLINGTTFSYEEVTLAFRNSAILSNAWMVETASGFVIQDNESDAIIYNGSVARRADPSQLEIPIGSAMAYGNGRLWVVLKDGRNLVAGDITTGTLGSEYFFTENQYLLGGGAFYFPNGLTGLSFLPVNNTASGYGSLMVFGKRSLISIRAEVTERDLWQIIPGFQTIVLDGIGTPSHHSITRVDQDLYWRDEAGQIRSLRNAAQMAQGPGNTPISREVARVVDYETQRWLQYCSGIYVDNRLFFTASPLISTDLPQSIVFQKIISLDCAPLATMRGKAEPAYDGEWTGVNISRMVQGTFHGEKRAFAIVRNGDLNSLWEFSPDSREDAYLSAGTGNGAAENPVPIQSAVEFRRFDFGSPSAPKELTRCDVYPSQIEGDVDVSVYWRVGNRNQWQLWGSFTACAEMQDPVGLDDNQLTYTSDFSNSSWVKKDVTVSATRTTDPDGGTSAQSVLETATNTTHVFSHVLPTIVADQLYEMSVQVRNHGRTRGYLVFTNNLGDSIINEFNLSTETATLSTVGTTANEEVYLEATSEGYFLVTIRGSLGTAAANNGSFRIIFLDAGGGSSYLGNVDYGFDIWSPSFAAIPAHTWKNLRSQERGRVKSLTIPSIEDPIMQLAQSAGYTFQIRLVWEGNLTIDRIDIWARSLTDKAFSDVFDLPEGCVQNTVENNELQYTIVPDGS